MTRNWLICITFIWIFSVSIFGWAENPATEVRVLDAGGGRIAGAVILVNPGKSHESKAFITDKNGTAYLSDLNCGTCVITAIDPRGLFFSKTTEFDGPNSTLTLILQVRPVIEKLGEPGEVIANIVVHDKSGAVLANRDVIIRPRKMTLTPESNWFYKITTDLRGQLKAWLVPGEYSAATLIDGNVFESSFSIAVERTKKCAEEEEKRLRSWGRNAIKHSISVQLSEISKAE